jgi:hypothetical protein
MADKRINDLPETTNPAPSDVVVLDGASTRKAQISNLGFALTDMSNVSQADVAGLGIAESDLSNVDLDTAIPQATESVRGTVPLATQSQTSDGTNNTASITPLRLEQKLASVGITESVFMDGYIKGLLPKYVNATTNRLQVGKCRDTGNNTNIILSSAIDKILATGWAAGDNNGLPNPVLKTGTFDATGTTISGTGTEFLTDINVGSIIYNNTLGQARLVSSVSVNLTGTLTSNGINISGLGTLFLTECSIGEHIYDPNSGESRTIVNIVSDTAIVLSTGFESDLSSVSAEKRTDTDCTIETAFSSDFINEDFYVGGIVGNATYHMFVLSDGVGGVECGYDWNIDATNLTAESGYAAYRRVFSFKLDSSGNIRGYINKEVASGSIDILLTPNIENTGFTLTSSFKEFELSSPTGFENNISIKSTASSGSNVEILDASNSAYPVSDMTAGTRGGAKFDVYPNERNIISFRTSTGTGTLSIYELGYTDQRI